MGLRRKTLTIIVLTMLGLIAFVFVASQTIMLNSYAQLEEQNTRANLERVLNVLSGELSGLDTTAHDWAAWDDTYAFVQNANPEYVKSNLVDKTFIDSRLSLMLFVNSSGTVVFVKAFDAGNEKKIPVPDTLRDLAASDLLLYHPVLDSNVTGIILLPDGPMLVASRPILTSDGTGPIRGTLILGRYIDSAEVNRLAETMSLPIVVYRLDDPKMPRDLHVVRSSLSEEMPILARPANEESIAGYALLNDVYGKPILILRVDVPRDIYKQGQASASYLVLALAVVGLTLGAVTILLLERLVLSPLNRLSSDVSTIATSGDVSTRISIGERNDELSNLASGINDMLEALDQSQTRVREDETLYRRIAENMLDMVSETDELGIFRYASPSHKRILGYEPIGLVGRSILELVHREDQRTLIAASIEALKTHSATITQFRCRRADGDYIWLESVANPLYDEQGRPAGSVIATRDIAKRKRAEEALRASESKYRALFENVPHGIYQSTSEGRFVAANPALVQMLGYDSEAELLAIRSADDLYANPQDREAWIRSLEECGVARDFEAILKRKDGSEIIVLDNAHTVRDEHDSILCYEGTLTDITERKRMEEKLRQYSKHLEELVEERTKKLRDAERFATIGQVAAMVGHDLRNPMQTLVNTLYLIEETWKTMPHSLTEETRKHGLDYATLVEGMQEQVGYMNKIVSDLQDYARPLRPDLTQTNLETLIADTLSTITIPETINVSVEIKKDATQAMVDPGLMKRVFTNLITNAIQAMPNGGQLSIRTSKADQSISIRVQDTGVGIPRENLGKLFMPLFTTKAKGQGFGLAACKRIIEAHSGTITLESTVGRGTTAIIEMPVGRGVS